MTISKSLKGGACGCGKLDISEFEKMYCFDIAENIKPYASNLKNGYSVLQTYQYAFRTFDGRGI